MVKKAANKKPVEVVAPPKEVFFPEISPKTDLECRVTLEDQILVIDVRLVPAPEVVLTVF